MGIDITRVLDAAWPLARRWEWLRRMLNRLVVWEAARHAKPRPYPLSLWGPKNAPLPAASGAYVSWTGLTDRTYTSRHLPPASAADIAALPAIEDVLPLFARKDEMVPCPRSTALFAFFAQWFTDSFLRTHPLDIRLNTSNHEIDLCQIYGLTAADTALLREGRGGRMRARGMGRDAFPPLLFDAAGDRADPAFAKLSYMDPATGRYLYGALPKDFDTPERRRTLYAAGLERGNSTIVYSALNTVFLREHNRLAGRIARSLKTEDDDLIFAAARNANIVQLLKIVISDYINHISGTKFRFAPEVGYAERKSWYRTNRISAEFNLLYRWHPLAPGAMQLDGVTIDNDAFRFNNALLEGKGVAAVLLAATRQRAGRIQLHNTAPFLLNAEAGALAKSRAWQLKPYNAYRTAFGMKPATDFADLTGDAAVAAELEALYGNVDNVELLVGLFAEQRRAKAVLGGLMTNMVAADAFTHALTNPLLSRNVYGTDAFSEAGLAEIDITNRLDDIVQRTVDTGGRHVSFAI